MTDTMQEPISQEQERPIRHDGAARESNVNIVPNVMPEGAHPVRHLPGDLAVLIYRRTHWLDDWTIRKNLTAQQYEEFVQYLVRCIPCGRPHPGQYR